LNPDLSRYKRQVILKEIGKDGQKNLFNSKVLVVGAGGLGCPVLSYLTSAGVGTIGIIDYDVVDRTNLQRQVLYDESQIGKPKSESAFEKLTQLNSDVRFKIYNSILNSKNGFELIEVFDVVIDATDNFKSRYLINDICVILDKPFVMGAINKFEGQAAVLNYKKGPTYRCIFPEIPNQNLISNCEESGVLGSLCGIVGTIQATETIKLITGAGDLLSGNILFIDSLNMEFKKIKVRRNQEAVEQAFKLKEKFLA
jgi:sulfur-carrier protein adenylyltransferase/sulfurtransferase